MVRSTLKRGTYLGSTGLGDFLDLYYTVAITIGETDTAVNLDTGSSDLWVVSSTCKTTVCKNTNMPAYPSSSIVPAGGSVDLLYGDSTTGTFASGPIAQDTTSVAGLALPQQPFAAISDTNNTSVMQGANGIFGLGFPSGSQVQAAVINAEFNNPSGTDDLVRGIESDGPLLSRLVMTGALEQPMFTIMLQRDTIDVSGNNGALTIGSLPDGIDNSSLTWVPVRLYDPKDGGLSPPSFAPNEIYPFRWEVPLDGVMLDGNQLPATQLTGTSPTLSALIDTGNSIIRGPEDVVNSILSSVSPAYAANSKADPTFPCNVPHNLTFQIGGQTFPVDPVDFMSQYKAKEVSTCVASNIVATDPPQSGSLFSWSLGDPFFKSNLVAFYYGNLTYPSVDPPRIGFLSMVPDNADAILQQDIAQAKADGGNFESTSQAAPMGNNPATFPSSTNKAFFPSPSANAAPSSLWENLPNARVLSKFFMSALFGTLFAFS